MLRLIRFLFTGDSHLHFWETVNVVDVTSGARVTHHDYECRCKHCGAIRKFRV